MIQGKPYTEMVDIWSLGKNDNVLLVSIIYGNHSFVFLAYDSIGYPI